MASWIEPTPFTKTSRTCAKVGAEKYLPPLIVCQSIPGVRDGRRIKKPGKETSYDHGAQDGSPLDKPIWGNQNLYHRVLQPIFVHHTLPALLETFMEQSVLLQGYQECHCPNASYTTKPSHGQLAYTDLQESFAMWRGSRDLDADYHDLSSWHHIRQGIDSQATEQQTLGKRSLIWLTPKVRAFGGPQIVFWL